MFDKPITFKEADQALAKRKDKTTYLKSREIALAWNADARSRAFFSARVANATILSEIHRRVESVVAGRGTDAQARALLQRYFIGEGADALAELGFAPQRDAKGVAQLASTARLKLIIDTNVTMAQEVGQYKQWAAQRDIYKYGIWKVGYSKEHRPEHLARDGKAYAFDHPIWTQSPPGGEFNCHCYRMLLREEDMAERGITPERPDIPFEPSSLGFNPARGIRNPPEFGKRVRKEYKDIAQKQMAKHKRVEEKLPPLVDAVNLPIQEALKQNATVAENLRRQVEEAVKTIDSRKAAIKAQINDITAEIADITSKAGGKYTLENYGDIKKLQQKRAEAYKLLDDNHSWTYIEVSKALSVPDDERLKIKISMSKKSAVKELVDAGATIIENLVSTKLGLPVDTLSAKGTNHVRSGFYSQTNTMEIYSKNKPSIVAHEIAHWVEHSSSHVHERCVEFLDYRCAGEVSEKLSKLTGNKHYRSNELARKDKFFSPYCGKDYFDANGKRTATEILSMGLERVVSAPLQFMREDHEYFSFVIMLMRGAL